MWSKFALVFLPLISKFLNLVEEHRKTKSFEKTKWLFFYFWCNGLQWLPISAGHAAEETRKYAHEILRSRPTADIDKSKKKLNKSSHNTCNQNRRDFTKKV